MTGNGFPYNTTCLVSELSGVRVLAPGMRPYCLGAESPLVVACVTNRLLGRFRLLLGNCFNDMLFLGCSRNDGHLSVSMKLNVFNPFQILVYLIPGILFIGRGGHLELQFRQHSTDGKTEFFPHLRMG